MDDKYQNMTDEQIVSCIHASDTEAMDYLLKKYNKLIKKETRTLYLIGGESEDLIQEGMLGLFKAVRDYDQEKGASFSTFAKICIDRQLYTAIAAAKRKKHFPLNTYISFYVGVNEEEPDVSLLDILEADAYSNPEMRLIDAEQINALQKNMDVRLSGFEKQVLQLYLKGLSYSEIGQTLGKTVKSIDNAVQRIRHKLSDEI